MSTEVFEGNVSDTYQDYLEEHVRGVLRTRITRAHLTEWLPEAPAQAIDHGGGEGRDAVWLAAQGYNVVLLEPAEDQVKKAHALRDRQEADVAKLIHITPARQVKGITRFFEETPDSDKSDLVLSHGVMLYLEDPRAYVEGLFRMVKPGGIVSLLTKGLEGTVREFQQEGRPEDELAELRKTGKYINHLGVTAMAYTAEDVAGFIRDAGGRVESWAGVRVDYLDNQTVAEIGATALERLLQNELTRGRDKEYRQRGQMLHFIGRRLS